MLIGIEKEPLIPKDQSQLSVERSTGPCPAIGTHMRNNTRFWMHLPNWNNIAV
jgi:hypothetical protein